MLPPIHKSTAATASEQRHVNRASSFEDSRKSISYSADRAGRTELQAFSEPSASALSSTPGSTQIADRLYTLERENQHFRDELQHLRRLLSSNQQQREDEKLSVSNAVDDLQRLALAFNNKLQADAQLQQREQQKAALLFAEVSRLGHGVEGLQEELRALADDTRRKLEAQDQHAQFLKSLSSKQQQNVQPERNGELERQLRDVQDTLIQLRGEVDADRSSRWKSDTSVDAKIDSRLERIQAQLAADKRELTRVLDEQRQLVTGTDFQRVASQMREFSRVHDHLLALERWLHGELAQVKRIFHAFGGDVDARFQSVLTELAGGLKRWYAALTMQENNVTRRIHDLEAATRAVALLVQQKLRSLEEVVPLEVQARQKNDDKLRRRVESAVKALGHAIEATRDELSEPQAELARRVTQLERGQQSAVRHVEKQHDAMQETIQAFMADSDSMLRSLGQSIEQERLKIAQEVAAAIPVPSQAEEEREQEVVRLQQALEGIESWSATHALECRQFCDYLDWSVASARRESAVEQCLAATIDRVVDGYTSEQVRGLEAGLTQALRGSALAQAGVNALEGSVQDARARLELVQAAATRAAALSGENEVKEGGGCSPMTCADAGEQEAPIESSRTAVKSVVQRLVTGVETISDTNKQL